MKKLPDGWKEVKLGEYFDVQLGKMLSEKARQGNQIPYLTNFNIRWGTFDLSHFNEMNFTAREKRKFEIKKNDLLMCEGGEVGRCAVWKKDDCQLYYQKALHRIRAKDDKKASTDYLYNYMNFICHSNKIVGFVGESSIAHLPREKLINIKIPLPPLTEQTAIAETLSIWDSAIEKTERLIHEKNKLYKHCLNQIYSKKNEEKQIKDFATETSCRNKDLKIKQVLSVTNRNGFVLPEIQFGKKVASEDLSNYKVVLKNQFAYNPSRINVGSIARLDDFESAVLSPMYTVFKIDEKMICSDYFLHWLSSDIANHKIKLCAQGGVRETVNFDGFGNIKLPLPEFAKQKEISESLNLMTKELTLLTQELSQYKLQKQGLMQKLLTGEWRIKQ